jgi:hypothetical protein
MDCAGEVDEWNNDEPFPETYFVAVLVDSADNSTYPINTTCIAAAYQSNVSLSSIVISFTSLRTRVVLLICLLIALVSYL